MIKSNKPIVISTWKHGYKANLKAYEVLIKAPKDKISGEWLRGGSDRGFLTLVQELGKEYKSYGNLLCTGSFQKF